MTRFRSLWILVAALAVTALLLFAAGELGGLFLSFVLNSAGSETIWWPLAVSFGSALFAIAVSLHQMRVHRRRDGGPGLRESRPRGAFWFAALVAFATIALFFVASAYCVFTTSMHLAGSEIRMVGWWMALFLAAAGVGLLMLVSVAVYHRVHLRHDGGPGLPGSRCR
jgi:hypothetical protein